MSEITAVAVVPSQYPADEREWVQLKDVIVRMYLHDGKSWKEVQQAMQAQYRFKAT